VVRDLLFALRQLKTNLRFSLIVALTLALGIGATTAIFSLVSGIVFRELPFPEPSRLVSLETQVFPPGDTASKESAAATPSDTSYADFFDWRSQSQTLEAIASYSYGTVRKFTPAGNTQPRIIDAVVVSADFFRVLKVSPILGRTFDLSDEAPDNRSVIISHEFWVSEFASAPDILGKRITLSDRPATVIGVMPPGFEFPYQSRSPAFWGTFAFLQYGSVNFTTQRGDRSAQVIARLRPGSTLQQVRSEMNAIQGNLANQYPEDRNESAVAVRPLLDYVSGDYQHPLYMLLAAVTGVLLIACVNVAGLMLARGLTRQNEFAVRITLGARPSHIFRQVLIESTLLSCVGGAIGLALARILLSAFLAFAPSDLPRLRYIHIDSSVLAFAFLVSLLTGVCFGVLPAWHASHMDSAKALSGAGRGIRGSRHEHHLHASLVVAETAISLILLAGSGLLIRSFLEMTKVNPGFDPHHTLSLRVGMSSVAYPEEKAPLFFRRLFSQLSAIPGVRSVTGAYPVPFTWDVTSHFALEGQPIDPSDPLTANREIVQPLYFETMRIPLLRGRTFDQRDDAKAKPVAIVNEQFAREFLAGIDPVGKSMQPDFSEFSQKSVWFQIVGVVGTTRTTDLTEEPKSQYFLPYEQSPHLAQAIILRVTGDPRLYLKSVRASIAALDPDVPLFQINTLDELIAQSTVGAAFQAKLLTLFAISALLLAAVGLYSTLSQLVARRTFEIGLRMALGAQNRDVFCLIMRRGFVLALIGLVVGFCGFLVAARFFADLLYNVQLFDPLNLATVSAILLSISIIASAAPAWRAARLQPTDSLREQ
jgi:putative ABC transport system permease protein